MNAFEIFSLTPLTSGDIIDRAARLYRRNFPALVRIVLAPSLIAYAGGILYFIGYRNFSLQAGDRRIILTILLMISGGLLWLLGKAAFYAMLGGATKSVVDHYFDGTPIRARDVYSTVRRKFWPLMGATFLVMFIVLGLLFLVYTVFSILILIYISAGTVIAGSMPYWLKIVLNVIFGVLLAVGTIMALISIYSHIIYVPQVLMVEEKGPANSIGRSFSLAGGEVKRIGVLILFWFYAAWSFWLLLMIPLGSIGYWSGIDINPFNLDAPVWYNIAQQTITQISEIIIAPIAMLGFTLLYLDSRVRKEGFDVELMANRLLELPLLLPPPEQFRRIEPEPVQVSSSPFSTSILGLDDINWQTVSPTETNQPVEAKSVQSYSEDEPLPEPVPEGQPEFELIHSDISQPANIPVTVPEPAGTPSPVIRTVNRIENQSEPSRFCRWCGTGADSDDRFCRVCGSVF